MLSNFCAFNQMAPNLERCSKHFNVLVGNILGLNAIIKCYFLRKIKPSARVCSIERSWIRLYFLQTLKKIQIETKILV